jgi:hypothetical protein
MRLTPELARAIERFFISFRERMDITFTKTDHDSHMIASGSVAAETVSQDLDLFARQILPHDLDAVAFILGECPMMRVVDHKVLSKRIKDMANMIEAAEKRRES